MITHEVLIKERGQNRAFIISWQKVPRFNHWTGDLYVVDDKQYYIKVNPSLQPVIREANGKKN